MGSSPRPRGGSVRSGDGVGEKVDDGSSTFPLLWCLDEGDDGDEEDDGDSPPTDNHFPLEGRLQKEHMVRNLSKQAPRDQQTTPLTKHTTEKPFVQQQPGGTSKQSKPPPHLTYTHPGTLNTQTHLISPLDRKNMHIHTHAHTHTVEKLLHSHTLCGNSYSPAAELISFAAVPPTSR